MNEAPLRRYFKLPAEVKAVDFVHQIDRAARAETIEKTLSDYEVTPSIARNLDTALGHVGRGVASGRSIFTWIHGSFGCGKSHFMNVLSLLLADEKAVYTIHPELQAQRAQFAPAVIGRKLFRLHVQCVSRQASTLEAIVFGAALEELARVHPNAPAPALFESQKLFASAERLLDDLGDEKFFAAFPSNKPAEDDGEWGEQAALLWDRRRFEAAVKVPQSEEARALAGELAKAPWFEGVVGASEYVRLGVGLQILAAHLKRLGYEGVVLFLDELVLWLSTFQDTKKLAQETPKVSTLVEHGDYPPVLPFLTFAARQRDLSEMVGKLAIGQEEQIFKDQLNYWKDRFETISLEDKDLPRIIEKRVLRVASPEAKTEIDAAFDQYRRSFAQDFRQLNGNQGDAEDFRRVYPFSPALVEVMVTLSATLQRDRTALRELTSLLVHYLPDFTLGQVVPVGDLFDVVASGKTSDMSSIQRLYEQARSIYENDLLPHIRKKQKTDNPESCQLEREGPESTRGCSGCAEKACRTQTRIAKTVLLQGLVPNTPVLKDLTASSLVYLNSGTLKSRVPNQETAMAATMLREWADVTTAVQVKGEANPTVRAVLDRIDVRRILDFCRDLDNQQRRRIAVRDILFDRMGVTLKEQTGHRTFEWRGRKWRIGVVYDNVRQANDNVFRPGPDEDLRLIVDYPFDELGFGPEADERRLHQVVEGLSGKDAERGLATVVWLPSFVDEDTQVALGDLNVIDGLLPLRDQDLALRIPFTSMEDIPRVRSTLEQQREYKRASVGHALESAYGVSLQFTGHLAPNLSPERQAHLLRRDSKLAVRADGTFDQTLQSILKQALEIRAPRHPVFGKVPTKARLDTVLELLDRVLETPERKARMGRAELDDLKAIAAAEHVGVVRILEEDATYAGGLLDQVAKNLAHQRGPLSVGAVRAALDPDALMDLSPEVEDFLVLAYAKTAPKPLRLVAHGQALKPADAKVGKLQDAISLVPVDLPSPTKWQAAVRTAGLFGISFHGKAITPARLDELAGLAQKAAAELGTARLVETLELLEDWQELAGIPKPAEATHRGEVLKILHVLVITVVSAGDPMATVEALAGFAYHEARTTAIVAMANAQKIASVREALRSETFKASIAGGLRIEADPARRSETHASMERVRAALTGDENIEPLKAVLESETTKVMRVLAGPARVTHVSPPVTSSPTSPPVTSSPTSTVAAPNPPSPVATSARSSMETVTVRSGADIEALVQNVRARLAGGGRVRVVLETLEGDER